MTGYDLAVALAKQLEEEGVIYEDLMQTLDEAVAEARQEIARMKGAEMVHVKKCPYGKRGKASTEFYIDGKPQIYCRGWIDPKYDEPIKVCKNCADFVDKAQEDLERSRQ